MPARVFFRPTGVWLAVILAATAAVYIPSLKNNFVGLDDSSHLLENTLVRRLTPESVREIFYSEVQQLYIPLTLLSFAVEYHFFADDPFIYHLDNLLLHLGVTALVFLCALRLGVPLPAAGIAALIFGLHPMRVESVAWVTERKDVLYAFFYMLALWCYLGYRAAAGGRKRAGMGWRYWLAVVFAFLSILSKPMALSLPLVLVVLDWWQNRRIDRAFVLDKIPFFLVVVPVTAITYAYHVRVPGDSVGEGALIWLWTLAFYPKTFFLPGALLPLYRLPEPVAWSNPAYLLALGIVAGLLVLLVIHRRTLKISAPPSPGRWYVFAFLFFFASVFFLLRYDAVDTNIVADRFMYLPSFGFCLLTGILLNNLKSYAGRRSPAAAGLVAAGIVCILLLLGGKTVAQARIWNNTRVLWDYLIEKDPGQAIAYHARGENSHRDFKPEFALKDFNKALELKPDFALAYLHRAGVYRALGDYKRAFEDCRNALTLKPHDAEYLDELGQLYAAVGQHKAAVKVYTRAAELEPDYPETYNYRGIAYEKIGRPDFAEADYLRALEINSHYSAPNVNLGNIYRVQGRLDDAIAAYTRALAIDQRNVSAYNNRAVVHAEMGNDDLALADYTTAVELNPDYAEAYNNRAIVQERTGRISAAVEDYETAVRLDPHYANAFVNLGILYMRQGDAEKAAEQFTRGMQADANFLPAYQNRAMIYANMGRGAEAREDVKRIEELGGQVDPGFLRMLELVEQ